MYAKFIDCPECNKKIIAESKNCGCGWKKSENSKSHDARCFFILNGKRCSLLGTMSSATHKSDGWLCRYHFETQDDFHKSSGWLEFVEKQFHEIIHFQKHASTNFKNCSRCKKLCDAENDFSKNENKERESIIF